MTRGPPSLCARMGRCPRTIGSAGGLRWKRRLPRSPAHGSRTTGRARTACLDSRLPRSGQPLSVERPRLRLRARRSRGHRSHRLQAAARAPRRSGDGATRQSRGGRSSAALIATGVLVEPPCFDRARPEGDCGAAQRLDLPLRYWPTLRSGAADLVIDRQLGQRGQCQHFMADAADGLTPVDPRFGVPGGLATAAYLRCIRVAGSVFEGILRDPRLAEWRIAGTYVLMHAIEDSFSAAHVDRDPHFQIVHLLSWTLIDWPCYALHGKWSFPAPTHHAASDRSRPRLRALGRPHQRRARLSRPSPPLRLPRGVSDRAREGGGGRGRRLPGPDLSLARPRRSPRRRPASLFPPAPSSDAALWMAFVRQHLPSVAVAAGAASRAESALPRPDVFVGAQGVVGSHLWGGGSGARGSSWDRRRRSCSGSAARRIQPPRRRRRAGGRRPAEPAASARPSLHHRRGARRFPGRLRDPLRILSGRRRGDPR